MMVDNLALYNAKMHFLRTGYCKHNPEFKVTAVPPRTNTVITNCAVCGYEFDRRYVRNPKA